MNAESIGKKKKSRYFHDDPNLMLALKVSTSTPFRYHEDLSLILSAALIIHRN